MAELPDVVSRVTDAEAFLGLALSLLPSIEALAPMAAVPATGYTMLAGHAVECLLKAYLAHSGLTLPQIVAMGHDLQRLWARASSAGLQLPAPPPWLVRLGELHAHPFTLRYPMGLNGLLLPGPEPMVAELGALAELVRSAIRS